MFPVVLLQVKIMCLLLPMMRLWQTRFRDPQVVLLTLLLGEVLHLTQVLMAWK
jgi:hypothetical protein